MTETSPGYSFKRKTGPPKDNQPNLATIQVSTPVNDNMLIRSLVPPGHISGFGWRACMVMLGVMYAGNPSWERAEEIWKETIQGATIDQLEEIAVGLENLIRLVNRQAEMVHENDS